MKIYKVPTRLGSLYVKEVKVEPFQHPAEMAQRVTYEECTPGGRIVSCERLLTGLSEEEVIAMGGVLETLSDAEELARQTAEYCQTMRESGRADLVRGFHQ